MREEIDWRTMFAKATDWDRRLRVTHHAQRYRDACDAEGRDIEELNRLFLAGSRSPLRLQVRGHWKRLQALHHLRAVRVRLDHIRKTDRDGSHVARVLTGRIGIAELHQQLVGPVA